jgi:hypothetical protein
MAFWPGSASAPLLADKLLSSTAETASAGGRLRRGICRRRCRRGGSGKAGAVAGHCLRVTIDLTRGVCRVHGRRCERYRVYSLTSLTESFGSKDHAIQ